MAVLTGSEFTAWLADPAAIRGTLVEVGVRLAGAGSDTTKYLSTFSYTTSTTDSPSNTTYEPIISGGLRYTERMDISGTSNTGLSVGDVELHNSAGELDSWLDDIWVNRPIRAYIGDVRWPRDSFVLIFSGVVQDIDSRNRNSINIKIRDKLQRINTPISELKYEDVYPYPTGANVTPVHSGLDPTNTVPQIVLPMTFGEVHNVTPAFVDTGNLIYMTHYGAINGVIEVRDNAAVLSAAGYTADLATGSFKMNFQPAGSITISLQGASTGGYSNNIANIIKQLVINFGKVVPDPVAPYGPTTRDGSMIPGSYPNAPLGHPVITPSPERFVDGTDIDTTNFSAFASANTQSVGIYVQGTENLLATCQTLASSVGAQVVMSRTGKLNLLKLSSPPIGTPFIITEDYMFSKTLSIVGKTEIQGSVKIGYCKNWTVQQTLLTNIPDEHKQLFATEWSTIIKSDATTISKYMLTNQPVQQDTMLLVKADADAEAIRRLNIYKNPHRIFRFIGTCELFDLVLGQAVQLVSTRFGLTGGVGVGLGTVVSLQPDWATAKIMVEVFV